MSCLDQFRFSFQLPAKAATRYGIFLTTSNRTFTVAPPNLWASCVSLINFFSSSIRSAVSLRTITSSMVSTTSPFSPRFRLQPTDTHAHFLHWNKPPILRSDRMDSKVSRQNKPVRWILTLVPLWSPGALNIWKHSAVKVRSEPRINLTLCDKGH